MVQFLRKIFSWFRSTSRYISSRKWLSYGLGLSLFIGLLLNISNGVWEVIQNTTLSYLLLAVVATMLLYPVVAFRWYLIANHTNKESVGNFVEFLSIRVFTGAGGFVGPREVIELGGRLAWLVDVKNLSARAAARIVFIDRASDLVVNGAALVGALAFWFFSIAVGTAAILVSVLILISACIPVVFTIWSTRTSRNNMARDDGIVSSFLRNSLGNLVNNPGIMLMIMSLSLVKYLLLILRVFLTVMALGIPWGIGESMIAVPLAQVAYMIAPTPGAVGVYETGWYALMKFLSVSSADIAAFLILLRTLILFSVIWLMPFLLLFNWRGSKAPRLGQIA